MRIARVRATPVNVPFVAPYRFGYGSLASVTKTIVEVESDTGLVGIGEVADGDRAADVEALGARLVGLDVRDLDTAQAHCVPGYHYSPWADKLGAKRAFGGIETALWDLRGQAEGASIAELLGGPVRGEVALTEYFSLRYPGPDHPGEATPAEVAASCAAWLAEYGSRIFEGKVGTVDPEEELEMVRLIRAAIGDRPLRLDANGSWLPETARRLIPRFEEHGIDAWEDPCETYEEFAAIRDVTDRPISTHVIDFERRRQLGVPDVFVTNLNDPGGIRAVVEIVRRCEEEGAGFRFHSGETGVGSAAYLQVSAALPWLDDPSQTLFRWYADDVIEGGPFVPRDGVVPVPTGPGLGVRLDPAALARCHRRYLDEGPFPPAPGREVYGGHFVRR
ncbi:MAG: mandelate racemase/muconate lactonizing enzyme family protein [Gaiellales bacterium]